MKKYHKLPSKAVIFQIHHPKIENFIADVIGLNF